MEQIAVAELTLVRNTFLSKILSYFIVNVNVNVKINCFKSAETKTLVGGIKVQLMKVVNKPPWGEVELGNLFLITRKRSHT